MTDVDGGNRFDLFGPDFKTDPFPTYARMRAACPVYAHWAPNGQTIWYITRYDDVVAVLKDHQRFVKDQRRIGTSGAAPQPAAKSNMFQTINQNMLFSDPPDHTRLRNLVNQAFTTQRVEQMQTEIQTIADDLLDQVAAAQEMDLIAAYAQPLPVIVISNLLGIPAADRARVFDWSQVVVSAGRHDLNFRQRRQQLHAFVSYLRQIFAARRQQPQDDLISALVQAEQAGDRLSEAEFSSMVALLLVTGHETTVNLIGNGVLALLQHPAQLKSIMADPALMEAAVEEILRYDSPVETSTTRWVREDITFRGQQMRQGDMVRVVIGSANRDADQFAQPDRLGIRRATHKHIAFGHGIHYCLGAPLARLEGRLALNTLFQRLPALRLAVPLTELKWRPGVLLRGLEHLPVRWDKTSGKLAKSVRY